MFSQPLLSGRWVVVLLILIACRQLPLQAQEQPRDQRLDAIEKALLELSKEVKSLRQPATGTTTQTAATTATQTANPNLELDPNWVKGVTWRSIGPANMGGRITDIAVYEADPSLWWIATSSGGLLKTTNNGVSMEHQFDHETTVSIGAVAVAQSDPNIVWVGTGEANPRNSVSYGDGAYKSTDGGKSWKNMGLGKTYQISRVLIHPKDPQTVYIGACGRLYGSNEDRGVYKTTDGGQSWTKVFYVDEKTGVIDMIMHPTDPNTLIAAFWDRERDGFDSWPGQVPIPDGYDGYDPIRKWGKGGGLFKTNDGGQNWKKLSQGLPSNATGRIGLDWYRKDPNIVFAIIDCENTAKGPQALPVYLGASGADADGKAKLTQIVPGSPAARAGLAAGDVVVAVGDKQITGFDQLLDALRDKKPRDKVTIQIARGEEQKSIEATLTSRPGQGGGGFGGGGRGGGGGGSRVWLGAAGEDREGKLTLIQILPESPAAKAGLKQGDVIVSIDGKEAPEYEQFLDDLRTKEAGSKLALKIARGSESLDVALTLEERPTGGFGGGRGGFGGQQPTNVYLGVQGEAAPDGGALLTQITDDGPAQKAKLEEGDVVQAIDGQKLADYDALTGALRTKNIGDKVKLTVVRGGETKEIEVTLEARPGGPSRTRPYSFSYGGQSPNIQDQQGAQGHEYGGIYRSRDGGETWERVNSLNSRPMYFSVVKVDPSDAERVYALGVSQYQSSNGGITFNADFGNGVHADGHQLWIDPRDGRHMIIGVDGGFYVTYDRGRNWDHINTTAIGQFYHVAISPKAPYWVVGGLQDNGSWGGPAISKSGGVINEDWLSVGSGDGFVCRVDASDPDLMYFESQNGAIGRRHLKTGERASIRPDRPRGAPPYRFNWNTPFMLSSHNSKIFYSAGNFVFRSLDRGNNLQAISPEITLTKRGSATALAESPRNPNVLYAGTDDGAVWVTKDGGHEWQNVTGNFGIPAPRWVSTIEASRSADGRVYVCLDAHRSNDDEPYVFISDDYGATFRSIRANLPWGSTRTLREDREREDLLYCGTEFGLWVSLDRGAHWTKLNNNLPTVAIHEVAQHPVSGEIVAATHGRSLWACDVTALRQLKAEHFKDQIALHKPVDLIRWQNEPSRGRTNRRFTGSNPAGGAPLWYSIPAKAQHVTLRIEDIEGKVVRELRGPTDPGLHRVAWDLGRVEPQRGGGQGGRGGPDRPGSGSPPATAPQPGAEPPPGAAQPPAATTPAGQPPATGQAGPPGGGRGGRGGAGGGRGGQGGRGGGQGGGGGAIAANGTYRVVLVVDGRELPPQTVTVQRDPTAPANVVAEEVVEAAILAEQRAAAEKALSRLQGRGVQDDD